MPFAELIICPRKICNWNFFFENLEIVKPEKLKFYKAEFKGKKKVKKINLLEKKMKKRKKCWKKKEIKKRKNNKIKNFLKNLFKK